MAPTSFHNTSCLRESSNGILNDAYMVETKTMSAMMLYSQISSIGMKNKNGLVPITEAMTTNQKVGRIQDVDSGFWDSSIVYGQMLEILIVHPDDAVDTLLLENKEQRGALTLKMSAWVPIERTGFARGPLVFKLTSSAFMSQKNYAISK